MERKDDLRSSRRSLVLGGLGMAAAPWFTACANRAPPPPPKPFRQLAVLPPTLAPGSERNPGFGGGFMYVQGSGGITTGQTVGANLAGALLVIALESGRLSARDAMRRALRAVAYDVGTAVQQQVAAALAQREVSMVNIEDLAIGTAARHGYVRDLPPEVDAMLDITIEESGFFDSRGAGGWSPVLNLWVRVRSTEPGVDDPDGVTYYADWRGSDKDKRWLSTPKAMVFKTVGDLERGAADARSGLDQIVQRLSGLVADDLQRHYRGLPFQA